ncbi:MAG: hypothetical protein K0R18_438 [Bacillales bacterium]|jgi:hypothetical protein|nr:hypothetical protein [Bacillales bacterium]
MISKPIQSRNLIAANANGEDAIVCIFCEGVESQMKQGILSPLSLHNGWGFAQHQNLGAQDFYYKNNVDGFLDKLLIDEVRNTYWCFNCASLAFSRIFASVIENNKINIGFSVLQDESSLKSIDLSLFKNFKLNIQGNASDIIGKFLVYNDEVFEYDILKTSIVEADIVKDGTHFGNIRFDLITNKLIVVFDDNTDVKLSKIISYVISTDLVNIILNTSDVLDYDVISAKITRNDSSVNEYTGCFIKTFNNK